jgi:hypothetical protein
VVQNNFTNDGGICYFDVNEAICKGFDFTKTKNTNNRGPELFDSLINCTQNISGLKYSDNIKYDYIVVYSWVKFVQSSFNEKQLDFKKCININSTHPKILLLSINSDYCRNWYPREYDVPNVVFK